MCGRIAQSFPADSLGRLIGNSNAEFPLTERWNVSPGQGVLTVRRGAGSERLLNFADWGFVAPWEKNTKITRARPINARAETVAASKLFGSSFKTSRCLVPVRCWYEWKWVAPRLKQPYALGRSDGAPVTLGGVISVRRVDPDSAEKLSLAIITTPAPEALSDVHDRAPLVIDEPDWPIWLGETSGDAGSLLLSTAGDKIVSWPISRLVNDAGTDGPELIETVEIEAWAMSTEGHA